MDPGPTHRLPLRQPWYLAGAVAAIAAVTAAYRVWLGLRNPTVVGLTYLLVVLLVASVSTLRVAVATSVLALLALNFFFMPPVGTFTLEDPQNWLALLVFLVVSVVGSRLSLIARERAALLEQRQEAERLRQGAELKSALLSSLSHDLKTPLTAIAVAADNARARWASDETRRDQLDVIVAEVSRLKRLFEHIVDMARIETGAVAAAPEWTDPSDIVDAAVQQAGRALEGHPLEIDVVAGESVRLDPRLTSAALAHVLENAGQYAPAGTPITVSARVGADGLALTVRDRGRGFAAEDVGRLFEPFSRGSGGSRHAFGTGMGLAITRGLLAAEGGRVQAENHPDGGARLTLTIPAPSRRAVPEEQAAT